MNFKDDFKKKDYENVCFLIFFIIIIINLCSYFHLTFSLDEEYSMKLIEHSYKSLISINMLDVHPPTYYLLLKAFIDITTFWTKSIYIKVISARLLSFFLFIFIIVFLFKILKLCNVNINYKWQLLIFMSIPSIQESVFKIRMYNFFTLFIIIELYELIKFYTNNDKRILIIACISALISSYTYYVAAICANLLLCIFIIWILRNKCIRLKFIIYVIIYLLLYSPLILLAEYQTSNRISIPSANPFSYRILFKSILISYIHPSVSFGTFNKYVELIMLLFLSLFVVIYYNHYHNFVTNIIIISYCLSIITCISIDIILHKNLYEPGSLFALFIVFNFLAIYFVLKYLQSYHFSGILIFLELLLVSASLVGLYNNINTYFISQNVFSKKVAINYNKISNENKSLIVSQKSVYLNNKYVYVYNMPYKRFSEDLVNNNSKLAKKLFNNIKVYNK